MPAIGGACSQLFTPLEFLLLQAWQSRAFSTAPAAAATEDDDEDDEIVDGDDERSAEDEGASVHVLSPRGPFGLRGKPMCVARSVASTAFPLALCQRGRAWVSRLCFFPLLARISALRPCLAWVLVCVVRRGR